MSYDILKAALEKKKQQTTAVAKSKNNAAGKTAAGNQVTLSLIHISEPTRPY